MAAVLPSAGALPCVRGVFYLECGGSIFGVCDGTCRPGQVALFYRVVPARTLSVPLRGGFCE
jgi:hypothetical protein